MKYFYNNFCTNQPVIEPQTGRSTSTANSPTAEMLAVPQEHKHWILINGANWNRIIK